MDTWIDQGQAVATSAALRAYVATLRAEVHHMHTGLSRAVWGVLTGRPWIDTPGTERRGYADVLHAVDMTVTPAGLHAKDATYRQSLAALFVALDAVDRATLTVWLADTAAADPLHRA